MKALNWGYLIGVIVVLPLLIALVNFLFFRGNKLTPELINKYMIQSETISLTVPPLEELDVESKVYYPRLKRMGDGTRVFRKFIFFSSQYQKYFAIIDFEFSTRASGQFTIKRKILTREATFSALVHPSVLNSVEYGTHDNPVPVFSKELLAQEGHSNWDGFDEMQMHFLVSEEDRRAYVSEYLEHFINKKEFKRLFASEYNKSK